MNLATLLLIAQLKLKVLYLEQQLAALTATSSAAVSAAPITSVPVAQPQQFVPAISYDGEQFQNNANNRLVLTELQALDAHCVSTTETLQEQYQDIVSGSVPGQIYWPGGMNPQQANSALQAEELQCDTQRQQLVSQM